MLSTGTMAVSSNDRQGVAAPRRAPLTRPGREPVDPRARWCALRAGAVAPAPGTTTGYSEEQPAIGRQRYLPPAKRQGPVRPSFFYILTGRSSTALSPSR